MIFTLEDLDDLTWQEQINNISVIERKFVAEHRWSTEWNAVLAVNEPGEKTRYFRFNYQTPATEMQDGYDWVYEQYGHDPENITLPEVYPWLELHVVYKDEKPAVELEEYYD